MLAGVYRKTHLFGAEVEAGFSEGKELLVVELAGRRVAPLICFDIEFPEPARQVTLAGAELLVTASANMDPFYRDHAVSTVARAHENRRPHLYANMVGVGEELRFVGASRSIAPTGEALVEASQDREELLVVPAADPGGFDEQTNYPKLVRPPAAGQGGREPDSRAARYGHDLGPEGTDPLIRRRGVDCCGHNGQATDPHPRPPASGTEPEGPRASRP